MPTSLCARLYPNTKWKKALWLAMAVIVAVGVALGVTSGASPLHTIEMAVRLPKPQTLNPKS